MRCRSAEARKDPFRYLSEGRRDKCRCCLSAGPYLRLPDQPPGRPGWPQRRLRTACGRAGRAGSAGPPCHLGPAAAPSAGPQSLRRSGAERCPAWPRCRYLQRLLPTHTTAGSWPQGTVERSEMASSRLNALRPPSRS